MKGKYKEKGKKTKQNKGREEERKEKMGVQKTEERGMEVGQGGGEERRERLSLRPPTTGHNMEMHSDWSAVYLGIRYSSVCLR